MHEPVMLPEVLEVLSPRPGVLIADGTAGGGGHALELARRIGSTGHLVALDRDPEMLRKAKERIEGEMQGTDAPKMTFSARTYEELPAVLREEAEGRAADGILLDLGLNSMQLDDPARGFSFQSEGPLDARFDRTSPAPTAADLVNTATEKELEHWFRSHGDERHARRIARRIVRRREEQPFSTTTELAGLVRACYPPAHRHGRTDPATRVFQALRIVVNDELGSVARGTRACMEALAPGGVLAILTFHSGEDRIVKRIFREATIAPEDPENPYSVRADIIPDFELATRKPLGCSEAEAGRNPRSRSARLRAIRRRAEGGTGNEH